MIDKDLEAENRVGKIVVLLSRYSHARELGYQVSDESLESLHSVEIELRRVMFKLKPPADK